MHLYKSHKVIELSQKVIELSFKRSVYLNTETLGSVNLACKVRKVAVSGRERGREEKR